MDQWLQFQRGESPMANDDKKSEPQSYGSQAEWVQGKTPQKVNPGQGPAASPQSEFYAPHRDGEENAPGQGGLVSSVQAAENDSPGPSKELADDDPTVRKVNGEEGGAKRGSYFKARDYR